ncbi:Lipid A export ATP-binding/permease protein MsbA [Roseovarius aestuarii]|uniref:Lipid A export ATP-binding/permease protein MsbA n=2 Tax=Roseovarius aestuarii TaxID=475083 RepID=A0A1X7BLZ0_9RHOB|nr:Lipid A export ATP-binding/permease protein MsbA [Roseovarius aestuarii]
MQRRYLYGVNEGSNVTKKQPQRNGAMTTLRRGMTLLTAQDRRRALQSVAASLLSAIVSSLMVWSVIPFTELLSDPNAVDNNRFLAALDRQLDEPASYSLLILVGASCALLALGVFLAQLLQTRTATSFTAGLNHHLGHRLLACYLHQPYEFFLDQHTSALSTNILSETEAAVGNFYRPMIQLAAALPTTIAVIAVLALMNATIVVLLGGGVFVTYGATYLVMRRRARRLGQQRAEANRRRFRNASESLQGVKGIKILGREETYLARFEHASHEMREAAIASQLLASVPGFALRAAALVGGVLFILLYVRESDFLAGQALGNIGPALGVLAVAAHRLMPEVQRILDSLMRLQYGIPAMERLHADLADLAPITHADDGERIRLARELTFEHVSYAYPGADSPGLSDINLRIPAGTKLGIVGRSGAGKTTLGDIALGLLATSTGRLLVDGHAVDDQSRRAWLRSVGSVPQDIFLADASVSENIALGLPPQEINMHRVRESARRAQIDNFVTDTLAEGYATHIGERGVRLSGGQRQRLAIARALYRDADLIVFDEATNALDSRTEEEVMSALRALPEEKTVLIIAHRLSTLDICDQIVVLENGRVAGFGTRAELEQDCPSFRSLTTF